LEEGCGGGVKRREQCEADEAFLMSKVGAEEEEAVVNRAKKAV
jgi:hypothetical protein